MIIAPFFAEFGWEVGMWIPWLLGQKEKFFPNTPLNIICRKGHEALYEPLHRFRDSKIQGIDAPLISSYDCNNVWVHGYGRVSRDYYHQLLVTFLRKKIGKKEFFCPLDLLFTPSPGGCPVPRDAIYELYGESQEQDPRVIVIHARNCPDKQPERNWPAAKWDELLAALPASLNPIAVGSPPLSLLPKGAADARGESLEIQIRLMARAKMIVGPSSGPLHLANMCGTKAIWWSGNEKDVDRYTSSWNPFHVKNKNVSKSWDPEVSEVLSAIKVSK